MYWSFFALSGLRALRGHSLTVPHIATDLSVSLSPVVMLPTPLPQRFPSQCGCFTPRLRINRFRQKMLSPAVKKGPGQGPSHGFLLAHIVIGSGSQCMCKEMVQILL